MIASTPWVAALVTILDLPGDAVVGGRSEELGLGVRTELRRRLLGALVGLVEHGDAGELRQQDAN